MNLVKEFKPFQSKNNIFDESSCATTAKRCIVKTIQNTENLLWVHIVHFNIFGINISKFLKVQGMAFLNWRYGQAADKGQCVQGAVCENFFGYIPESDMNEYTCVPGRPWTPLAEHLESGRFCLRGKVEFAGSGAL